MSVEIEVGLENAAEIPGLPEDLRLEEPPKKGLANPRVRRLLMIGLGGDSGRIASVLPQSRKHR